MASSSGNSSGSSQLQNSGSEEDLPVFLMDQKKRKRMQSNRESARRSRMRKQKQLDDLTSHVSQLSKDNNQILTNISITAQHLMNFEAENSILRAQMMELTQRLDSLNEILNFINATTAASFGIFDTDQRHHQDPAVDNFMSPLTSIYLNQPIMTSPDLIQY